MSKEARDWLMIVGPIASMALFLIACLFVKKPEATFVVGFLAGCFQTAWQTYFSEPRP